MTVGSAGSSRRRNTGADQESPAPLSPCQPKSPGVQPLTDKRDLYTKVMGQGLSNSAACRIVGVSKRTGLREAPAAARAALGTPTQLDDAWRVTTGRPSRRPEASVLLRRGALRETRRFFATAGACSPALGAAPCHAARMGEQDELVEAVDRYPNGTLRFQGHNLGGQMHGAWVFYRADGSVMRAGSFNRGRQVGVWRTLARDGRVVKETDFGT